MVVTILITIAFVFLVTYQYRIENNDKNTEVSSPVTTSIMTTTTAVITTTTEPTTVVTTTKKVTITKKSTKPSTTVYIEEEEYINDEEEEEYIEPQYSSDVYYSASEFQFQGVIWYNGLKWTYYSDSVLPGEGLSIPGRHYDSAGYICDNNDYIVLASCDYAKGTVLNTPLGKQGKIYDYCPTSGIIDVYVGW